MGDHVHGRLLRWSPAFTIPGRRWQAGSATALRHYDPAAKRLDISARASGPSQRFQLLHQVALLTQNDLLEATLDLARFSTPEARDIAKSYGDRPIVRGFSIRISRSCPPWTSSASGSA